MKLSASYIERLKSPRATADTLYLIMGKEFNPRLRIHRNFNNSTFETLTTTGDIGLLDSDIALSISELNKLQERVIESSKSSFEFKRSNIAEVGKSPPISLSKLDSGPIYELMIASVN